MEDVALLTLEATILGVQGWDEIHLFGVSRLEQLRPVLRLSNGVPRADTIRRVIGGLDSDAFRGLFIEAPRLCADRLLTPKASGGTPVASWVEPDTYPAIAIASGALTFGACDPRTTRTEPSSVVQGSASAVADRLVDFRVAPQQTAG